MSVMLPMVVYRITGSAFEMGIIMTLSMVPQIILLPFTGLLVDRASRTKLMVLSDAIRFCLLVILVLFSSFNRLNMSLLYGYAILAGIMSALFQPAYSAVRAQVFTPEIRNAANALTEISVQIARLIGPTIGGIIVSFTSLTIGFGIDAVTFLISMISLLTLRINMPVSSGTSNNLRNFALELFGGYQELRKHRWLWITIVAFAFINTASAGFVPILIPWLIKEHLGLPAYAYGVLVSFYGIGSLIAALVFGQRQNWKHRGIYAYCGVGLSGIALGGMAFLNWLPGMMMLMALNGAGITVFGLIWEGSLQEMVPREAYGRVASLDMLGSWALLPVGYLVTGMLAKSIGGSATMVIEALLILVMIAITLSIRDIRCFE